MYPHAIHCAGKDYIDMDPPQLVPVAASIAPVVQVGDVSPVRTLAQLLAEGSVGR